MSHARCSFVFLFLVVLSLICIMALGCGGGPPLALEDPSMTPTPPVPVGRGVTVDDLLYTEGMAIKEISPDGSAVAWDAGGYIAGSEDPVTNLFVTRLDDLSTQQVTSFNGEFLGNVQWSPDGSALSFISNAAVPGSDTLGGQGQVWAWKPATGELAPLTNAVEGVRDYDWKDADTILFTAEDGEEVTDENAGDDTIQVTEYARTPVRLFELDIENVETQLLTHNDDRVTGLFASPDGNRVVLVRTRAARDSLDCQYYGNIPIEIYLLDLDTLDERRIFEDVKQPAGGSWSPDSRTFYLIEADCPDNPAFAYTVQAHEMDISSGAEKKIDLGWDRGIVNSGFLRATDRGFVTLLADGCNPKLAAYTKTGGSWNREMMEGEHVGNIFSCDVSADGRVICYVYTTASRPQQGYAASIEGAELKEPRQFTALNPHLADKVLARSETITWSGARGDTVEGMLYYPADYLPGKKYPLVIVIHGGPFGATVDGWGAGLQRWAYPYQLLSAKGAFILDPNYHGSSYYGFDFADSISDGKFYEYPLEDIEKGISRLVELGMVDETRLGTLGWSNGAILSHALVAGDDRFKAASCGAGGAEWVSLWGQCQFGDGIVSYYFGGDPVSRPDIFKDPGLAPFYRAESVKTPVLMFLSGEDESVPPVQVWITYRGLQKYGQAPVELYVFPGEPHVLQKLSHQRRKMIEEQEWFDKYLFETAE